MGAQVGCWDPVIKSLDGLAYSQFGRNLKTWFNFEHFVESGLTTGQNVGIWQASFVGAGAVLSSPDASALRPGIIRFQTGTTNVGRAGIFSAGITMAGFLFAGGVYTIEGDIYVPVLSTALEEYLHVFGFGDTLAAEPVDGVYFLYDRAGAGVNWRLKTSANSIRTDTDSGVAVAAASWIRLKIVVNADATLVSYWINGVLVGTNVLTIPSGANRQTGMVNGIRKTVGVTNRYNDCDWMWSHLDLAATI
jgi:hypothetical protein